MIITSKYDLGEIVYLITDNNQLDRIVTTITILGNGAIIYEVSCGENCSTHYDFEMASEKNMIKQLNITT